MLNKISRLLVIASLASLAACGGGDDSAPAAGVTVMGVNGSTVVLDSVYSTPCYYIVDQNKSVLDTHTFSGNTLTVASSSWPGNVGCTNPDAETVDYTFVFTVVAESNIDISGWVNGENIGIDAPLASDNLGGTLDANETVTPLTGTVTSVSPADAGLAVGDVVKLFYVVDNSGVETGSNLYLYRDKDYNAGDTHATTADRLSSD